MRLSRDCNISTLLVTLKGETWPVGERAAFLRVSEHEKMRKKLGHAVPAKHRCKIVSDMLKEILVICDWSHDEEEAHT